MSEQDVKTRPAPEFWPEGWPLPTASLRDIVHELRGEARGVVRRHAALLKTGDAFSPDETTLRRAVAFHQAAEFLTKVAPHIAEVNELVEHLQKKKTGKR